MSRPSLGRTVIVAINDRERAPAIINAVHSAEMVSVCTMPFGRTPYPLTSVPLFADEPTFNAWRERRLAAWLELTHPGRSELEPVWIGAWWPAYVPT